MAGIEFPEETRRRIEQIGTADLVIGVAGTVDAQQLRHRAASALAGMSGKIVVAYSDASADAAQDAEIATSSAEFLSFSSEGALDSGVTPWSQAASAHRAILSLASQLEARGCAVLHSDLETFNPDVLVLLTGPVLAGQSDLVMPVYPEGKYDGLLNKCMLAPLSRILFGRRVRFPLAFDFSVSGRILPQIAEAAIERSVSAPLLWPSNLVAAQGGVIEQARLAVHHNILTEGLELSTVLSHLAGSLFQEVESSAAHWQRVRASQPMNTHGTRATETETDVRPMDVTPMIESFSLATRNLEEIWRLVMPPVTLLELKRLARLDPAEFRMPDPLWVRVIYDFALGYRVRNISRVHLLGALTPLYLGWVASYAQEMANASVAEAEQRIEQLAQVFEENKPYLLARWRWPDRMNL